MMDKELMELITMSFEEQHEMTEDEYLEMERDFWSGLGELKFILSANREDVLEIEDYECSGCVGGLLEGIGLEYVLEMGTFGDLKDFEEGRWYTIHNVTVTFIRGDGWTTDDDADYDFTGITEGPKDWHYWKTKIRNLWWFTLGYRIRNWRSKKC